ncbi:acyltransferase family protein [uncultured Tenacibaculum sp.]|uniref:acyltransferase family protein n=1 Tax=uncultured Tenacibaculum sp. TaxID=174713 RepID=UPI002617FA52|nr:acyltransferase family protein [uncultured Tenacibaculum sp.]
MEPIKSNKSSRQFYIDWLRILLIFSVFLFHIGMYFNSWEWHVKNNITVTWLNRLMWFLHLWRMPLLFLVSGVGTYYALGHRTVKKYLNERFTRLFIPFVVGIITLVPVQVYIEKIEMYSSLGSFYLEMFNGVYPTGNFSWHHLWFILYLFLISLLISPFLNYLRSDRFNTHRQRWILLLQKPLALNLYLVLLIGSQAILRQWFPESTHALYNDWAYFIYYILFFIAGFILITDRSLVKAIENQRRLYLIETVIATIFLFSISSLFTHQKLMDWLYGITGIIIGWSCGLAALGYSKKYFNKDSRWRKRLNEGIYPFYLLHQPVIIVLGYYLKNIELPIIIKMLVLILVSFVVVVLLYELLIKRFNVLRVVFGMKKVKV